MVIVSHILVGSYIDGRLLRQLFESAISTAGCIHGCLKNGEQNMADLLTQNGNISGERGSGTYTGRESATTNSQSRRCDECTACCSGALQLEIEGQVIFPGHPCRYRQESGCGIYATRPEVCKSFRCGWLAKDSPLPQWLRPDRSGVIMLFAKCRWRGLPVDVAVAVGCGPQQHALDWLMEFSVTHHRPLLYQVNVDGAWYGWGPSAFRVDLDNITKQGQPLFSERIMYYPPVN